MDGIFPYQKPRTYCEDFHCRPIIDLIISLDGVHSNMENRLIQTCKERGQFYIQ